ncbi:hypothetical protein KR044_004967, partial [Drosophila immigrans]
MSLPIKRIKYEEVVTEIKCLNNKKAPGPDKIDSITLKTFPPKCIRFLTLIFNAILRLEHFPSQWKCAEIIMILKPHKTETELTSCRPISLLTIFSKVFEKILLKRMLPILDELSIIPKYQFGFRRGHGTTEQ